MTWRLVSHSVVDGRVEAELRGVGEAVAYSGAPSGVRLIVVGDVARVFFVNDEEPAYAAADAAVMASFLLCHEANLCECSNLDDEEGKELYCEIDLSGIGEGVVIVRDPGSLWLVFDYFEILPLWNEAQTQGARQ